MCIRKFANSALGGGLWHPEAAPTAAMRREIDRRPQRIKAILTDGELRKEFLEGASKSNAKCVKAFIAKNADNALKTKPKVSPFSSLGPSPSMCVDVCASCRSVESIPTRHVHSFRRVSIKDTGTAARSSHIRSRPRRFCLVAASGAWNAQ